MTSGAVSDFDIVKRNVDLARVVRDSGAKLTDKGNGHFRSACPIHGGDGKNAFSITYRNGVGHWKCFSGDCGGGSVIDYWMALHNVELQDAVVQLADFGGIQLPERRAGEVTPGDVKKALGRVARRLSEILLEERDSRAALAYLDERGMDRDMVREWGIGFLPKGSQWVDDVEGVADIGHLVEGGFLAMRENGDRYSMFSGRIVFPIRDATGKVVGFGGRTLDPDDPRKYINPRETIAYSKSRVLFGMDELSAVDAYLAREFKNGGASKRVNRIVLVEGYLDAIAINSVCRDEIVALATCGTALTPGQIELVADRKEVVLMMDGDQAGKKAMSSAYWTVNHLGDKVKGILLDGGDDPWDLYRSSPERLEGIVSGGSVTPLMQLAASVRRDVEEDDLQFDRWVTNAYNTVRASGHKDLLAKSAGRLRDMDHRRYLDHLAQTVARRNRGGGPQPEEEADDRTRLSRPIAGLVRRMMQSSDVERNGVLGALSPWDTDVEDCLVGAFPIKTEMDIAVMQNLVSDGHTDRIGETEVDRVLAECMTQDDAPTEDIGVMLRGVIAHMRTNSQDLVADAEVSPLEIEHVNRLRFAERASRDVDRQLEVLAFLLDLSLDLTVTSGS